MSKQLSEEQQSFVSRTHEHIKAQAIGMVDELLAVLVKEDIPFADTHYLFQRAKEILMEKMKKVKFEDKKINDARRNRLFESICQAKEVKVKMEKDADERTKRNEPIAQEIIDKIVDATHIFSDQDYLDDAIKNDDQLLLAVLADTYLNFVYDHLITNLSFHEPRANTKKWGGKEREARTWKDLDDVLSKND